MARWIRLFTSSGAGALCWALGVLWMGCSGGGSTPAPAPVGGPGQTTAVTVTGPGGVSVTVPPGASAEPVSIKINQSPVGAPALDSTLSAASSVFAVTPHGQNFDLPVTVEIPINVSAADEDTDLVVLKAEEGGAWQALPDVLVDDETHIAQVEVTSFSYFVVIKQTLTPASGGNSPVTIKVNPLGGGYTADARGDWTYDGGPAPRPTLVPLGVSVTGSSSCPSGGSARIVGLAKAIGTRSYFFFAHTPLDSGWPADATEMDLPLMVSGGVGASVIQLGLNPLNLSLSAVLFCPNGQSGGGEILIQGVLARTRFVQQALLISSPLQLGIGREPADTTVAPGGRPVFTVTILGGPYRPDDGDEYTVDWQRSDDGGLTWRSADDYLAYELQMPLDPHLWSLQTGSGFPVREGTFTAPPVQAEDDGAVFQARVCYAIPPALQQYSTATTDCVFSRPAQLTVSGSSVSPVAPTLTQQPQAITVAAPAPATFSVAATGDAPLTYQWLRDGVAIVGATSANYTTPPTGVTDSGATFSVVVWNPGGAVVSAGAELTVTSVAAGFQVTQIAPADGSLAVSAASLSAVTATFSAGLDCTHLPPNSLQVIEGASTLPGVIGCNANVLSFTPALALGGFPTNTTLNVLIDGAVRDGTGDTLGAPFTSSFGVAPWTRQIGSAAYDEARAVRVDTQGNVFAIGYTNGGLDGNTLTGTSDLFVIKYAPSGAKLWTRELGSPGTYTYGLAAAVDSAGNLYAAGNCGGDLDGNASHGSSDMFVVKYDPSGTKLWTHLYGTPSADNVGGVVVDPLGNVLLSGWSQGAFTGAPTAGAEDIVLLKLDADGTVQWAQETGSSQTDETTSIASDGDANVLVAGYTTGVLDGLGNAGAFDVFVAKFDPSGVLLWTRQLGTPGIDNATSVAADASGNVYVAGYTYGSFDGHPNQGAIDGFVVKYDASGTKQWSLLLGTPGNDFALGVAVDASGTPYVVGSTNGALDGGSNNSATQFYVARLDPTNGALRWAYQEGAVQFGYDTAEGVVVDSQNNIFASGFTNGGLDGNTNAGDYDAFVVKIETTGRKR